MKPTLSQAPGLTESAPDSKLVNEMGEDRRDAAEIALCLKHCRRVHEIVLKMWLVNCSWWPNRDREAQLVLMS